jgi:sarcosine oxidase subunit alpha
MTGSRLATPCGQRIDRTQRLSFEFNGRRLSGHSGDTLASALLANGVQLVGRSFKLHRPRGIFSCGVEEPNGIVDLSEGSKRTPNMRATLVDLYEGLVAASVNCWPSVGFDMGAINSRMAALLPAGFYYKTFKWPNWHLYEPTIRRMAGLGRASGEPDADRYEEASTQADVLVVGGGLAGLSAAVGAAEVGADTLLLASAAELGGALAWRSDPQIAALILRAERSGLRRMTRTMAFGIYDHNLVCARESLSTDSMCRTGSGVLRERLWKIRARAVIAAGGALERPMIFPNNDRPGVMLAGAADKYAHAFGVACGQRVVIAANSDSAYQVAASLRAAGVNVIALVDRRPPADIDADAAHVRTMTSAGIAKVGGTAVRDCTVISTDTAGARPERLECDLILSAGGYAPSVHLHSQAGGKLRWVEESAMFVPDGAAPGVWSAGACAGMFARDARW